MNTQLMFLLNIPPVRFTVCASIGHWSSGCHNKNILEDLEMAVFEYETAEEFLADIKKEFGGGDKEMVKVAELKKLEQKEIKIEEFMQKFKRAVRESKYEERPLVEEFKRGINGTICQKLIKSEWQPSFIEQ